MRIGFGEIDLAYDVFVLFDPAADTDAHRVDGANLGVERRSSDEESHARTATLRSLINAGRAVCWSGSEGGETGALLEIREVASARRVARAKRSLRDRIWIDSGSVVIASKIAWMRSIQGGADWRRSSYSNYAVDAKTSRTGWHEVVVHQLFVSNEGAYMRPPDFIVDLVPVIAPPAVRPATEQHYHHWIAQYWPDEQPVDEFRDCARCASACRWP